MSKNSRKQRVGRPGRKILESFVLLLQASVGEKFGLTKGRSGYKS